MYFVFHDFLSYLYRHWIVDELEVAYNYHKQFGHTSLSPGIYLHMYLHVGRHSQVKML